MIVNVKPSHVKIFQFLHSQLRPLPKRKSRIELILAENHLQVGGRGFAYLDRELCKIIMERARAIKTFLAKNAFVSETEPSSNH